ncbi:MAG TPA: flagellar export chaperone FliS [Solirubrobacteraceae bacterium]|nr:flagellar export chaperone FliS [Solirubrobacteraceae bacterium]
MSNVVASPDAYRQGAVLAATPVELVVMLYDGARRFLRQASAAMREAQIERAHNSLRRAELIVAYLEGTLDHEQGDVAANLHSIYRFCLRHLNEARRAQDADKVEEVSALLGELREAWAQIAQAQ